MAELNGRRNGRIAGMAGMAEWQKEWQNGRMAEMDTYVLFTVHTDTDDDTDDDTLIIYSIDFLSPKHVHTSAVWIGSGTLPGRKGMYDFLFLYDFRFCLWTRPNYILGIYIFQLRKKTVGRGVTGQSP